MMGLQAFYTNSVVRQVDVPTLAGTVGILANHVPTLGVLKPGVVQVTETDGNVKRLFVSSGTLSMNIDGTLQVLAEEAITVEDIDEAVSGIFYLLLLILPYCRISRKHAKNWKPLSAKLPKEEAKSIALRPRSVLRLRKPLSKLPLARLRCFQCD